MNLHVGKVDLQARYVIMFLVFALIRPVMSSAFGSSFSDTRKSFFQLDLHACHQCRHLDQTEVLVGMMLHRGACNCESSRSLLCDLLDKISPAGRTGCCCTRVNSDGCSTEDRDRRCQS